MSEQSPLSNQLPQIHPLPEQYPKTVQARVLELFGLAEGDFEPQVTKFVASRVAELSQDSPGTSIGMGFEREDGFIAADRPMVLSKLHSRPYKMDDPSAYTASFKWLKLQYSLLKQSRTTYDDERLLIDAALRATQIGQVEYFGSYTGNETRRMVAVADLIGKDIPPSESIAVFGSSAMCKERAAVVHNTLKIIGVDSSFMVGNLHVVSLDKQMVEDQPHAWVVVRPKTGGVYQYDPTNPILHIDADGEPTWADPNVKPLDANWHEGVDVGLEEWTTNPDGSKVASEKYQVHYTYSVSPF
ncbi:hypothetical protein KDA06_03380 [Candidatus Saccharibacteria bacterium]|nr:hypothetical protein [Candidatus Saccharibacteria bacterium]HPR09360.1 hypothetical protein [Candidatus Saccharibacteria bacterium]